MLPFAALAFLYVVASQWRLSENPDDKLLPSLLQVGAALHAYALEEDARSGQFLLWVDTCASLRRIGLALGISGMLALAVACLTGVVPRARALLMPLVGAVSMIPPLAILPVLFIVLGLEETAKVSLIVIGIMPVVTRDLAQRIAELPVEQIIKVQTLGASTWQLLLRVVLPQILPRLLDALRLAMGSAWLFLIAAEAIASTEGLGYRIFLVRRYLAMDVILPYVIWITLLAAAGDWLLRKARSALFGWAEVRN